MNKKSITFNYVCNIIYEILSLLTPLITTPYVSRVLGADGIGTYSYTYSIAAYFTYFAALGSTVYGRRETAYLQDDRNKRSIEFWELITFRGFMTIICLVSYGVFVFNSENKLIYAVQGIYILTVAFDLTWLFQGMENFGTVVLKNTIIKIAGIIFIFIFVKTSDDLLLYIFGSAIFPLFGSLILWTNIGKYIDAPWKMDYKKLRPFRHFKGCFLLFIPTIASQVYTLLDKTMIGIFASSSTENGYYEQAQKVIKICSAFVTTFSTVMFPRIAYVFSQKDEKKLRDYMRNSFRFLWLLSVPLSFGVFAIADNLVPWFFGSGFEPVKDLLHILGFVTIPIGLGAVIGSQYFVATGKQNLQTISIILGAVLNFTLNLFLIPNYLAKGAAIASIIAESFIAIIQIFIVVVFLKDLDLKDVFFKFGRYIVSGFIMGFVVFFAGERIPATMGSTLFLIILGACIYLGILLMMRDDLLYSLIRSCLKK